MHKCGVAIWGYKILIPVYFVQNKHLVKMCKCRVAICDYKILSPEGFTHFYVLLGPILVLDWFKKRLVQTGPRTVQD